MDISLISDFGFEENTFKVGGIGELLIVGHSFVNATISADGEEVTALTLGTSGKTLNEIRFAKNTCSYTDVLTVSGSMKYYTQTLNFTVNSSATGTVAKTHQLVLGKHVAIVKRLSDGKYVVLGLNNGLDINAQSSNSGANPGDEAGKTFVLDGFNLGLAPFIDAAIVQALK